MDNCDCDRQFQGIVRLNWKKNVKFHKLVFFGIFFGSKFSLIDLPGRRIAGSGFKVLAKYSVKIRKLLSLISIVKLCFN